MRNVFFKPNSKSVILIICLFAISFQNCGPAEHIEGTQTILSFSSPPSFAEINTQIFQTKCLSCHNTAPLNLTSYDSIMGSNSITPGDPTNSYLYTRISNGSMPPSGPLSDTEKAAVYNWILAGALPEGAAPTPPAAPTNLIASAASSTQINLSWNDNSDSESGFKIERSLDSAGPFVEIAVLPTNSAQYINSSLTPSTTYYYRVYSYNGSGNSTFATDQASTLAVPSTPPQAPSSLSLAVISPQQINLTWSDNSNNEEGFKIERALVQAGPFSVVGTVNAGVTTFNNLGLNMSTTYYYRVHSFNSAGASQPTAVQSATTSAPSTFTSVNTTIFIPLCLDCHSGKAPAGKYNMSTYSQVITRVIINNSINSLLFQRVEDGTMPKGAPNLTPAQLGMIKSWIDNGAPNN